jgi:hypothetical protein
LFRYSQGVIYFDAEIPNRAFDFGMSKQKLDGPEISGPTIDQGSFCASQGMPNSWDPNPTLPIHSETRRYWRCLCWHDRARSGEWRNAGPLYTISSTCLLVGSAHPASRLLTAVDRRGRAKT